MIDEADTLDEYRARDTALAITRAMRAVKCIVTDSAAMAARLENEHDNVHPEELAHFASNMLSFSAILFTDAETLAGMAQPSAAPTETP